MTSPADDDALAELAVSRGLLTAAQVAEARARLAMLQAAGLGGDLLGALEGALPPAQVAALRALAPGGPAQPGLVTAAAAAEPELPPEPARRVQLPGPSPGLPQPGERVGPYRVERELGRGGMGAVYVAEHVDLRRRVALKLRLPRGTDPRGVTRFVLEARAAARVRHPGVVGIHDAGSDERGRMWLAMDLVDGEALDQRLARSGPLPPAEVARVGLAVARAVAHAHADCVLHRDLKPANILCRASDGAVLVTDFGLAKVVDGAESLTRTGEVVGTPTYMPPEQACGREVDGRADVWSLGATLYHLLTGVPPFTGGSVAAILAAVLRAEVEPPRRLRPDTPAGLEAVILRCLEKEPARRYRTAAALADDLERVVRGERPDAPTESLARARGGGRGALALVCALALLGLAGAALALRPRADGLAAPTTTTSTVTDATSTPPPDAGATTSAAAEAPVRRATPGVWLRAEGPSPPARYGGGAAWDPVREVVVLHGGRGEADNLDDLWLWDGVGWTAAQPAGPRPEARHGHAIVYDRGRRCLVVVGGNRTHRGERPEGTSVWELPHGGAWREVQVDAGPGPRSFPGLVWSPSLGRVLLHGGSSGSLKHADLWTWDGTAWSELRPEGPRPAGRAMAACVWDVERDLLVVVGGRLEPAARELWEWRPSSGWTIGELVFAGLAGPGATWSPGGAFFFGGFRLEGEAHVVVRDAWRWDGRAKRDLPPQGDEEVPGARRFPALVLDEARGELVLFGGSTGQNAILGDTWRLSLSR